MDRDFRGTDESADGASEPINYTRFGEDPWHPYQLEGLVVELTGELTGELQHERSGKIVNGQEIADPGGFYGPRLSTNIRFGADGTTARKDWAALL